MLSHRVLKTELYEWRDRSRGASVPATLLSLPLSLQVAGDLYRRRHYCTSPNCKSRPCGCTCFEGGGFNPQRVQHHRQFIAGINKGRYPALDHFSFSNFFKLLLAEIWKNKNNGLREWYVNYVWKFLDLDLY